MEEETSETRHDRGYCITFLPIIIVDVLVSSGFALYELAGASHVVCEFFPTWLIPIVSSLHHQTVAIFVESLVLFIAGYASSSRLELLRLCLLLMACGGILLKDHRLSIPGTVASLLAMVSAAVHSSLKKMFLLHFPRQQVGRATENKCMVGMSILVAICFMLSARPKERAIVIEAKSAPFLILNACSTAAALQIGLSTFVPINSDPYDRPSNLHTNPTTIFRDVATLGILVGVTGCLSTLSTHRSYASWCQVGSFLIAVLCISSRSFMRRHGNTSYFKLKERTDTDSDLVPLEILSSEIEAGVFVGRSREENKHELRLCSWFSTAQASLTIIAVGILWSTYLYLNFRDTERFRIVPRLDHPYNATRPVEIVLSMYKESYEEVAQQITDLRSISRLSDAHITIYIKDAEADLKRLKKVTKASEIIMRSNIGREGETYLNHILARWDHLAAETLFLQAHIHNPRGFYTRLNNYYLPGRTGFLSLGWSGTVCSCVDCSDQFFWRDETHLFPHIQAQINATCGNVLLSYKGQFVVSAARIRGLHKSIYHELWQALVDEKSWAHQEPYLQGRRDSMSAPFFGFTVERMWNLLFQCSEMDVAWKCPSLMSGWRPGGDTGDCQCFDR